MKHGVSFLPDSTPATQSATAYFDGALQVCELADQVGFDYVKMTEHYLHPYGAYCPSPLMFLSAVAARTRRIRLMTGGIMASFHHPVQIAAHAAMLDALSGGRADIGFARAWLPHEFDLFELSMDESRERFVDTVEAVVRVWTEEKASADSRFFQFSDVDLLPRLVQRPHPPVWVAAVQSPESFTWIAEHGFGLLVTPGLRGYGALAEMIGLYRDAFPGPNPQVALSLPLVVRPTTGEAVEDADRYLSHYLDVWTDAATQWDRRSSTDYARYTGVGHVLRQESAAGMRERVAVVAGGPDDVVDQIHHLRAELDPDVLLWQIDTGAQGAESGLTSVRLFAEKVQPKLY
ncbi:LLM class flavin-dependent oxidoreductase [Nonomuraea sp. NPDC046570]|uniref:LLM class flavin-dependent oxidoreductase n=1 Tax=Nonomuraea sp. NPDC046570 TaxID=3155255 RepID=UPI0033C5D89B